VFLLVRAYVVLVLGLQVFDAAKRLAPDHLDLIRGRHWRGFGGCRRRHSPASRRGITLSLTAARITNRNDTKDDGQEHAYQGDDEPWS
jgi:hypothetical protein